MAHRAEERTHHTRLGWWIMTHDRGGTAAIGGGALALLLADAIYTATQWHAEHDKLARGFLFGFGVLVIAGFLAKALGLDRPIGPDRRRARVRARFANLVGLLIIGVLIVAPHWFGSSTFGVVLGEVAAVSAFFAAYCCWWIALKQNPPGSV